MDTLKKTQLMLTALLLISGVQVAVGQFQHPLQWERVLGGRKADMTGVGQSAGAASWISNNGWLCLATDGGGNIYVVCSSLSGTGGDKTTAHCSSSAQGRSDLWLVKLDPSGNILWQRNIGGAQSDQPVALQLDEARSCMYLVATSNSVISCDKSEATTGQDDVWIVKLDWNGNICWDKSYGGFDAEAAVSAVLTDAGDLFCLAYSESYTSGGGDIPPQTGWWPWDIENNWAFMIDSSGTLLWNRWIETVVGSTGWSVILNSACYRDGKILLSGDVSGNPPFIGSPGTDFTEMGKGGVDMVVAMLDTNGVNLWNRTLGGSGNEGSGSGCIDPWGNSYLLGYAFVTNGDVTDSVRGYADIWVVKLDAGGAVVKNKILGGAESDVGFRIYSKGPYLYLSTLSRSTANDQKSESSVDDYDPWLVVLDTALNLIWEETIVVNSQSSFICPMADSGLLAVIPVMDTSGGDFTLQCWDTLNHTYDMWLMKFAPLNITGLPAVATPVAAQLSCAPNPFQQELQVGKLEEGQTIEVYTLQGQPVGTWGPSREREGFRLETELLPPGMYLIRNGSRQCRVVKM